MAQPPFVPQNPRVGRKFYESPERTRGAWKLTRPGDSHSSSPTSGNFQGPDQGYALLLAERFRSRLQLSEDSPLSPDAVLKGCVKVALKRASLLGRAPVASDIEVALLIWGFLDAEVPKELLELRRELFVDLDHNKYGVLDIVELCSQAALAKPVHEIRQLVKSDPLSLFETDLHKPA